MAAQWIETDESGSQVTTILDCLGCSGRIEHRTSYHADSLFGWSDTDLLVDALAEAVALTRDLPWCTCLD